MYAIIEDSGTQIKVSPGDVVDIDPRDLGRRKKKLNFDRVLLVGGAGSTDGTTIGAPYVKGAAVTAEILGEVKGQKIDVVKFKRRKGYQRRQGHRQLYLRVKIAQIKGPGSGKSKSQTTKAKTEEG